MPAGQRGEAALAVGPLGGPAVGGAALRRELALHLGAADGVGGLLGRAAALLGELLELADLLLGGRAGAVGLAGGPVGLVAEAVRLPHARGDAVHLAQGGLLGLHRRLGLRDDPVAAVALGQHAFRAAAGGLQELPDRPVPRAAVARDGAAAEVLADGVEVVDDPGRGQQPADEREGGRRAGDRVGEALGAGCGRGAVDRGPRAVVPGHERGGAVAGAAVQQGACARAVLGDGRGHAAAERSR